MENLKEIIEEVVNSLAEKTLEDRSNEIHVTDLTTCIRKSYYVKKYGFPVQGKTGFYIYVGYLIHDVITQALAEKLDGKYEVECKYNYNGITIHGRADVLCDDYVIELKTCNKLPFEPYQAHKEQVNFYLHVFDKPMGYIVYISRANFSIKVFDSYGDWQLFQHTLSKAEELHRALKEDKPPKCNIPLEDRRMLCSTCPFAEKCFEDSELNFGFCDITKP